MKKVMWFPIVVFCLAVMAQAPAVSGCTNFLVTKGASVDGSTMISYAADAHDFYGELVLIPGALHLPGEQREVYDWDTGELLGRIDQVPRTYTVVGNMNEHQVSIGETTFEGREELAGSGMLDYGSLMFIALERATTAREAIAVIAGLVDEYGYASTGESISIADPDEVWLLEIMGKGEEDRGAVWVARRIPDGYVSAHANQARIGSFPLDDPESCLYAEDVISFARDRGYFDGKDEEFSFADTYAPADYATRRLCAGRVWCMYHRVAPSAGLPSDYVTSPEGGEPLPLWIEPDHKLSVHDVMQLMRDHFEGTPLDMTRDPGAGGYELPYRWRPLVWELDGVQYFNERATATQQTAFSFVAQARSGLPDAIGGVLWFGVDDAASTVYVPMYCGIDRVPPSYAAGNGSLYDFTWDAAFWVFNWVANFSYLRYNLMIQDVEKVQRELEGGFLARQQQVEAAALALHRQSPQLAVDYLTEYSVRSGQEVVQRWRRLGEFLLVKYLDGNVKTPRREVTHPGYSESWYRGVVQETGDRFLLQDTTDDDSR